MSLILTTAGLAALAAAEASGTLVTATHMAVGDGNGETPEFTSSSTALVNEVWRGELQSISINEEGETEAGQQVVFEAHIPLTTGGWYIRECALYADDTLLAIGAHPTLYKPDPDDPTKVEHIIKAPITFGNADLLSLVVDPAVVLASQEHVGLKIAAHNVAEDCHADIRTAVSSAASAGTTHAEREDNPHATTAEQVGLGNLPNAISDSVASSDSECVASSAAAKTAYDAGAAAGDAIVAHAADATNPHATTAEQVGLGNLPNAISDSVASSSSECVASSLAAKTAYDRGTAAITSLSGHTASTSNPHSVTAAQVGAAASSHTHAVAYKATRTASGSWSITGCTVGVPLYIMAQGTASTTCDCKYQVTSGGYSSAGYSPSTSYPFGISAGNSYHGPHTVVILPSSTTVVLNIIALTNMELYAYQ